MVLSLYKFRLVYHVKNSHRTNPVGLPYLVDGSSAEF